MHRALRQILTFALAVGMLTLGAGAAFAQQDFDCDDFASQADGQLVYDADPSDPFNLDVDGDGIACEGNGDDGATPTGGVETGAGGTAESNSTAPLAAGAGAVVVLGAGMLMWNHRRATS